MKKLIAAILSLSVAASAAVAAERLPAGKPAGVRKAQEIETSTIILVAAGAAIVAVAVGLSDSGSNGPAVSTQSAVGTAA